MPGRITRGSFTVFTIVSVHLFGGLEVVKNRFNPEYAATTVVDFAAGSCVPVRSFTGLGRTGVFLSACFHSVRRKGKQKLS